MSLTSEGQWDRVSPGISADFITDSSPERGQVKWPWPILIVASFRFVFRLTISRVKCATCSGQLDQTHASSNEMS